MHRPLQHALCASLALLLCACAAVVERAGDRMAGQIGRAVLAHDDPQTVRDGMPAYLLLLEGMIEGDPDSAALRLSAAELNAAYAGSFVDDEDRARRLSQRALEHAWRAQCAGDTPLCPLRGARHDALAPVVATLGREHLRALYALGSAWATWIQAHRDDWNAIADIPKVAALLERVVALAPDHDKGMPMVYLGVLGSLRPAALGGRPEEGRARFEEAIARSGGRNLMAKVLFAEHYARLVFDRDLHDRLLAEVLAADPSAPGLTLSNVLAQQRARALQDSADAYF